MDKDKLISEIEKRMNEAAINGSDDVELALNSLLIWIVNN